MDSGRTDAGVAIDLDAGEVGPVVSEATRHVMQANKSKNTKPELIVRSALREAGLPGYRLHWKAAAGRPDVCFPGRHVAIFVNGCFWHRCPYCALPEPKSNVDFWEAKFARNRERDARDREQLVAEGWTVVVVWECKLKRGHVEASMAQVERVVRRAGEAYGQGVGRGKGGERAAQGAKGLSPEFYWPREGRVIEIGAMPVWRRRLLAKKRHMRHSMGRKLGRKGKLRRRGR